jgi:hypothetical protein
MYYTNSYFSSVYGSGTYDGSTYNGATTSDSTGSSSGSASSGGSLTNTGFDITLIVTIACVMLLAAVIIRFWKRSAKNESA